MNKTTIAVHTIASVTGIAGIANATPAGRSEITGVLLDQT